MTTVLPFSGMRPRQDLAEQVAAPPYDVVSSKQARELARDKPYSFLHINKPEIDLDPDTDPYSPEVYAKGAENIRRFIDEGVFITDAAPAFYIYRQSLGRHSQTGLVGLVSVDEYEQNIIRKHELTRPAKENDRVMHMDAVKAQTGPVFLTYRAEENLDTIMEEYVASVPEYDFVSDDVRHRFWIIPDPNVQHQVSALFHSIPALFVADGHHRSAAAARYRDLCRERNPGHQGDEPYNYFMAVLFPHDQLNILGYHRAVRDLGSHDSGSFLKALETDFMVGAVDTNVMPQQPGQFGVYLEGTWYRLDLREPPASAADDVAALDVAILQDRILTPLLDIGDPRTDPRLDFIGGIGGQAALEAAVDTGDFAAAFACYPVSIEQLMAVADKGKLMPPKSTWFEPKLKSGLVMHYLG